ncbi:MAG: hypothetical protein ACYSOQ_06760, partial [Planctomycetota bacterium]
LFFIFESLSTPVLKTDGPVKKTLWVSGLSKIWLSVFVSISISLPYSHMKSVTFQVTLWVLFSTIRYGNISITASVETTGFRHDESTSTSQYVLH